MEHLLRNRTQSAVSIIGHADSLNTLSASFPNEAAVWIDNPNAKTMGPCGANSPSPLALTPSVTAASIANLGIRRSTTTFNLAAMYPDIDANNVQSIFLCNNNTNDPNFNLNGISNNPSVSPSFDEHTQVTTNEFESAMSPFASPSVSSELGKFHISNSHRYTLQMSPSEMDYFSDESFEESRKPKRVCLNDRSLSDGWA
eukprot:CAMPEP_0184693140 /NCGR_PEP_ID=MMETSP0313-20130426/1417_1 /TAXON_ID=2792 /ORGANISM="Porphyridium aerugineum, Strain SAG 1380-2" /LENGTH=199 /DNA_ID=CAMNT_0027151113 /DNA_START=355 /DNA_END=954 /DNA_ORIENTATION=-